MAVPCFVHVLRPLSFTTAPLSPGVLCECLNVLSSASSGNWSTFSTFGDAKAVILKWKREYLFSQPPTSYLTAWGHASEGALSQVGGSMSHFRGAGVHWLSPLMRQCCAWCARTWVPISSHSLALAVTGTVFIKHSWSRSTFWGLCLEYCLHSLLCFPFI